MYTHDLLNRFRDNIAVVTSEGQSFSYGDLVGYSTELYKNIGHRCLVFSLCSNTIDSLCGYVSFISNRIVPLMLDDSIDHELLGDLIKTYNPEYIWLPAARAAEFSDHQLVYERGGYMLFRNGSGGYYPLYNDLALLLTTSGSTGSPKLVRLSYENMEANARSIVEYLKIGSDDRQVTTLPMSYSYGLSIINTHFIVGATILLTPLTLMDSEFWSFVKRERATTMGGVPYTYEILRKLRFFKMNLPHLKTLTQAGGKLNIDLNREFAEFCFDTDKRFFVMYGQTEATARMSYLPSEYALAKLGSMGRPIPGGEFSLIDESKNLIESEDTVGELVYSGRNVSLGYAESGEDLSRGDENKGLLVTGDMAKRDSDNFYYIVGRKKRFIKLFGNRVNLDETERLLKNIIHDCACVGDDDMMVVYITEPDRTEEVREYLSGRTGINIQGFMVRHIDHIPKNSSGKTIYGALRQR